MRKKITIEEFIEKAKETHPNEDLDYSKVAYVNNRTPVCIIDHDLDENGNEYGEFWQTPYNHLRGQSHPRKKSKKIADKRKCDFNELIKRFKEAHPNENLDYSKSVYINMHTPILIIDHDLDKNGNEYGEFWQEPNAHLKGHTNKRKGILWREQRLIESGKKHFVRKTDVDKFIEKARAIHGDKYDYSKVDFSQSKYRETVCIICPKHGEFWQTPYNHLISYGCPKCSNEIIGLKSRLPLDYYVEKGVAKHSHENLEYKDIKYKNGRAILEIYDHDLDKNGNEYGLYEIKG